MLCAHPRAQHKSFLCSSIMAFLDVIEWVVSKNEFCHRMPQDAYKLGCQLVVHQAQTAFFVKGGQIADEFKAGTYTLKSENLPILGKLVNLPFGGDSPFMAEVWFVNQITRLDMKWGTPLPIQVEDPRYGIIVPIRAFGQYGIKIENPRLFLETLIGNLRSFTAAEIDQYFKAKLLLYLNSSISRKISVDKVSILDINAHLPEISEACCSDVNNFFVRYGISLVDFSVISITVPPDDPSVQKLKEAKAKVISYQLGGKDFYQMERSYNVLDKVATNESSVGTAFMGVGAGFGLGGALGQVARDSIQTNPQSVAPPPLPQEVTFYLYVNGQQWPNVGLAQIRNMVAQNMVTRDTLVWKAGMANWVPAGTVPELAGLFFQTTPPVPPVPPAI